MVTPSSQCHSFLPVAPSTVPFFLPPWIAETNQLLLFSVNSGLRGKVKQQTRKYMERQYFKQNAKKGKKSYAAFYCRCD